jgi:hypothetical protein
MDNITLAAIIIMIAATSGIIAGAVAYAKVPETRTFIAYFVFGTVAPLLGILFAAMIQPAPQAPQPPGWYTDPWEQAALRYWDGQQWTWHTTAVDTPAVQTSSTH